MLIEREDAMRKSIIALAVALAVATAITTLLLHALPSATPASVEFVGYPSAPFMATKMPTPAPTPTPATPTATGIDAYARATSGMVVKEGFVRLIVPDVEQATFKVLREVERMGGYLVKDEGGIGSRTLTVRVPSEKLDEFVEFLSNVGILDSFSISITEVSETYVDLSARLNSSRALERRLLELLSRAESVDEVLKVEEELRRVRAEVEKLEAELRRLKTRVEYSTVTIILVGGAVSYGVTVTTEVEDVEGLVPRLIEMLSKVGRVIRSEYGEMSGAISVEVPTNKLDEVEGLIPGRIVERRVSASPSSTGTSTITISLIGRARAYAIEVTVEVPDVDEAFKVLLSQRVGRVETATAWKDGGIVVISLPSENLTKLEELLPGNVVARRVNLINARESKYAITLKKYVNPVVKSLEDGVEALGRIALLLLTSAVVVVPIGLVAYGGYVAYRRIKVKRKGLK